MNVTSTLDSVTIYREGAVCLRRAAVEPPATGVPTELRLVGLPLSLAPGSLRARVVKGPPELRVLDVRPAFDVQLAGAVDQPAEKKALDAAVEAESVATAKLARLDAEISELEELRPTFLPQKKGSPPREAPVEAIVALAEFTDGRLAARLEQRRALTREVEDLREETALRRRRLAEASSAQRTERARVSRCALVTLSSSCRDPIELGLEYQVSGARWVPSYQLRLDRGFAGGALRMRASVAQDTGEDWAGVSLALSTASLTRRTDLPELKALKIGRRQPEPPRPGWREPPPGLDALFEAFDDAQRAAPARPAAPAPVFGAGQALAKSAEAEDGALNAPMDRERSKQKKAARGGKGTGAAPLGGAGPGAPPPPPRAAPAKPMMRAEVATSPAALGAAAPSVSRARMVMDDERTAPEADMALAEEAMEPDGGPATGEYSVPEELLAAPPELGIDAAFLDYSRLVMAGVDDGQRGRLHAGSPWALELAVTASVQVDVVLRLVSRAQARAASVLSLPLPVSCRPVESVDSFDYRYDCAGRVDVGSTGSWTTLPVMDCQVGLTFEHVCVPAVEQKVYRTLLIQNSTPHALLAGPVDVSAGDEFLLTTSLPTISPGADTLRLGLGVEEAIKVARKTQFRESTGGFLGGSTVLFHEIAIELNNRLGSPARLEVRERIPFPDPSEKDVKVEEAQVTPPWEKVEAPLDGELVAGVRRWRVSVPAAQKLSLLAQFNVRIPAGKMLVGGNRRV